MVHSNAQRADYESDEASSATRRPVDSARHGNVEIAIWKNTGTNGAKGCVRFGARNPEQNWS